MFALEFALLKVKSGLSGTNSNFDFLGVVGQVQRREKKGSGLAIDYLAM